VTFEPEARSDEPDPSDHTSYRTASYPDAANKGSAKLIEIHPAEKREINFRLAPEPVYRISGVVDGADWRNNNVILQLAHPNGDELLVSFFCGPGGYFVAFDIPSGSYVLETQPLFRNTAPIVFLPITVGGNTENIHTTIKPMVSIPVVVERRHLRKSSTPVGCHSFITRLPGFSVSVHLVSQSKREMDGFSDWEDQGGIRGPVVHARPGRYAVDIEPEDDCGWFVESATYGNTDLLHEDIVVPDGTDSQPIKVVLQDNVGKLTVKLMSETEERPIAVLLAPEGTTTAAPRVQWGLSHADVVWESVAPGAYSLYAFDEIDDLDYTDPDTLSAYSSKALPIEIHPDEEKTVGLQVITRGEP